MAGLFVTPPVGPWEIRALMLVSKAGLVGCFEQGARALNFRRIVTPSRKFTGDNSDAIDFEAPVDPGFAYVIHGNLNQAAWFSMTGAEGAAKGDLWTAACGAINDRQIDVDDGGNFTVWLGGDSREAIDIRLSQSRLVLESDPDRGG